MADKAPVQAELSGKIAKLIHCFDSAQGARQWLMIAARTVRDEWGKLDKYRVDKYYMLLRHLLAESFFWLGETSWEEESAGAIGTALQDAFFGQQHPNGIRLHMADIFCEELKEANAKKISSRSLLALLEPLFSGLAGTEDPVFFKRGLKSVVAALPTTVADMPNVELQEIQARLFDLASSPSTRDRYRAEIYAVHKMVQQSTGRRSKLDTATLPAPWRDQTMGDAVDRTEDYSTSDGSEEEEDDDEDEDDEEDEEDKEDEEEDDGVENAELVESVRGKLKSHLKGAEKSLNSDHGKLKLTGKREKKGIKKSKDNASKLNYRLADQEVATTTKRKRVSWGNDDEMSHADSIKALKANTSRALQSEPPSRGILAKSPREGAASSSKGKSSRRRASDFF